jgi:Ca-activated chloride channel family protein
MNARNEREIARLLADVPSAEPPADLLARIKADLPEVLPVPGTRAPGGGNGDNALPFRAPRTWLAAAAAVVMFAGGGLVAWRLTQVVETPQAAMEMSEPEARREAPAESPAAAADLYDEAKEEAVAPGDEGGEELRRQAVPSRPAAEAEPVWVGTAAELEERQEYRRDELREQLEALGYAGEGDQAASNRPVDSFDDEVDVVGQEVEIDTTTAYSGTTIAEPLQRRARVQGSSAPAARSVPKPSAAPPTGPSPEELSRMAAERRRRQVPTPDPTPDVSEAEEPEEMGLSAGVAEEITVSGRAPIIDGSSTTTGATFGDSEEVPTRWHPSGRSPKRSTAAREKEPADAEENQLAQEAPAERGFRDWGVSPFVDSSEDRLSTFGLDVDTGSYTVLRRYVEEGRLPPPAAVRVEEIVNWFTYSDPFAERPARSGETFRVVVDGAPSPVGPAGHYRLLRFQVAARPVAKADRKPAMLTLVVDNSGSMEGENLELVRAGLRRLVASLGPDDRVALIGFSGDAWVVAPHGDRKALVAGIEAMEATNSTNAEAGLKLGYELAGNGFREGWSNRVILLSDGVANVGATGPEAILTRIGRAANRGIELTTVGVGMGNFNDDMLEQLADRGDGRYAYVDRPEESERLFVEELTGTLQTVAEEARVQVELDPRAVVRWRLLGYENRDIADERFRHDHSVDAGEVGAGQQVTALYEIELADDAVAGDLPAERPLAEIKLRWREPDGGEFQESSQRLLVGDLAVSWGRASRDLRLAAVAAELAEVLRGSPHARGIGLRQLVGPAKAVAAEFPGDDKVAELAALVEKAAAVAGE